MDDPLMLAAATTLVAWVTTNLAEGARSAVTGLTDFLRHRFRREAASWETVEVALRQPTPDAVHRLAALLHQEARRDATFGAEFRARFAEVQAIVEDNHGDVTNTVSGDVSGPVVQARDVHGGITFGGTPV
ncbi:hypothetical protein ACLQ2S_17060 [Micromonospora sp. DT48]|uniref:hypothetical protein n=1 Tax=unclassified Micromonospora TaxID=2617518 RepID=UPI0012BBD682|nr:hypothetical protein [Micromonospora sp. CP22]MTK03819.1 hypothetical protein [Micromonospora sp. CP22]